jgi:DNA topoisomerase-3
LKSLYIAEKPSVAQEFGKALHEDLKRHDGYLESENSVVTWCVGHLVTMSYPDQYDESYRRWSFDTLPFLPKQFKYEIIPSVKKQYDIVSRLLNRADVGTIYVCTDSGREGEYIYRLVAMMAGIKEDTKTQKRVWIDSQTEEEIHRGIREAKDLSQYNHLASAAFLRAKEDYLMGINFSRALSLRYSYAISDYLGKKYQAVSVGRVMTCVLGMVVRREREIRNFKKQPFYRVLADLICKDGTLETSWQVSDENAYRGSPKLYRDNGFLKREDAETLIRTLKDVRPQEAVVESVSRKTEKKNPPLLYNLAELQNDCSKRFHISPDQTLAIVQELYEKKLVTYPRTDARVLSSAIAKQIDRNIRGLGKYTPAAPFSAEILAGDSWKKIGRTRYTDDAKITDHYAIIPTGQGFANLGRLENTARGVYDQIVRRFLSVFYPPAEYKKTAAVFRIGCEKFIANERILVKPGYLKVTGIQKDHGGTEGGTENTGKDGTGMQQIRKGSRLPIKDYRIKEGETSPPKRYTSGSIILAMENAGQLIEDEELRAQIKGSGIGTSATRAEILKKLFTIRYLSLNKKTQVITPTQTGEMIYDVVNASIRSLLNPELTASWEKGLTYVAEGSISEEEYMQKLEAFVRRHTENVKGLRNQGALRRCFDASAVYYKKAGGGKRK